MDKLLNLLAENARLSLEELATMTGMSLEEVAERIQYYEDEKIILGYRAVIDWEKMDDSMVEGFIDLRISPKKGFGFDEFAELVSEMPEVKSCYLVSGGNDISLTVEGKSLKDIAMFVGRRLATMDSVISTSTRFVLRCYKKQGRMMTESKDERELLY